MGMDFGRSRMGLLLLLAFGWVALSEGTGAPMMMRIDTKTIEHTAQRALVNSKILEEMAESATKNQGNTKAIKGIKGLKLRDMQPPNITVTYVPNMGTSLKIRSQITIAGKSFIGGTMEITIVTEMTTQCKMMQDDEKKMKLEVKECDVKLISCKTNLPSSMLPKIVNKFLDSTLKKILPGMMCPAATKVASVMEGEMNRISEKHSIGDRGEIQYVIAEPPEITNICINVPLQVLLHKKNGEKIEIPSRKGIPSDLPAKKDGITEVIMPADVLDGFMELFKDDFRCDVSSAKVSSLTTDKLAEMIPSMAGKLPRSKKVKAELRLKEPVTHSLGSEESSMKVHSTVDFIKDPEGGILLSFDTVVEWEVIFDEENEKLKMEIRAVRVRSISVTSPSAPDAKIDELKKYVENIVSTGCVPAVNKALAENQVDLPNILGASYKESKVQFEKFPNTLMLDVESSPIDYLALMEKMEKIVHKHP